LPARFLVQTKIESYLIVPVLCRLCSEVLAPVQRTADSWQTAARHHWRNKGDKTNYFSPVDPVEIISLTLWVMHT